jgi:hypothetical protein
LCLLCRDALHIDQISQIFLGISADLLGVGRL